MNWLLLLGLAVVVAAFAAVTGIKPKETRPVAHTRMMGMARLCRRQHDGRIAGALRLRNGES